MTRLRLGTRGSRLALVQARAVATGLEAATPGVSIEIVEIRTSGDRLEHVPLGPDLGQSFFTKEIEDALLDRRIDIAVHSCKDLATRVPGGLALTAFPPREDPHDALLSAGERLTGLPAGARIGTGSERRRAFLRHARPDLVIEALRGNVTTRAQALDEGRFDAIVLAVAGLRRLDLGHRITEILEPDVMLPAAAQGALAVEVRSGDTIAVEITARLDHAPTRAEVTAERSCMRQLGAGCQAPVGVLARLGSDGLEVSAAIAKATGVVRASVRSEAERADEAGAEAARMLLEELGLSSLRDIVPESTSNARGD